MFKKEWGIRARVLFLTLVPTITISILLSAYFTSARLHDLEQGLRDRGYAIATQYAPACEYAIFSGNMKLLNRIAQEALSEVEVRSVDVFDRQGHLLIKAGHEHSHISDLSWDYSQTNGIRMTDTGNSLLFTVPVIIRDVMIEDYTSADLSIKSKNELEDIVGWVQIELGRMTTTIRQYQVLFACSVILLIGLVVSGLFVFRMSRDVTRPILEIASAVERIKNGDLEARVFTKARGELRHLEGGINTMAASLKAAHDEMQQSVEQATADLRQTLETIEIQNIELEMARKEAETASRVKSEFLANMSHEIRTPLNGVIGFINLMRKTKLDGNQTDYLVTIQKSAQHLMSIINDILDFSKIEAGKLTLDYTPTSIRDCIEEALTLLTPAAHEKQLVLVPLISPDFPEKVLGDHLRLKQVITNLVSNSIKFTPKGSVIVEAFPVRDKTNYYRVSVTDTGIGLTASQMSTIFQAFKQADSSTTRRFGGTGLGLVISKRLVEQMHGEIGVTSEVQQGSTFYFTFRAEEVIGDDKQLSDSDLAGISLAFYEPHPESAKGLESALMPYGVECTRTESIDGLAQVSADMALVAVPQSNAGCDVLERIRCLRDRTSFPIGLVVNTHDVNTINMLEEYSPYCLAKPYQRSKLIALLEAMQDPNKKPAAKQPEEAKQYRIQPNYHILAVDDYPANLKLVNALLTNLGCTVYTANSGQAAVETFQTRQFDLILMDIQMPEMDGIEATNRIRAMEKRGQHTPIIALTAHALLSEREALFCAGMDDYLTKPINELALENAISKWVNPPSQEKEHSDKDISMQIDAIDWESALKLAANKTDLAKDMLQGLVDLLVSDLPLIKLAFKEQDFAQMRERVHKIHGACAYTGVPTLQEKTRRLEQLIAERNANLISQALLDMTQEAEKVCQAHEAMAEIAD